MSFSGLFQRRKKKVSSNAELLSFDLLYQLSYLSTIAATGMPRNQIFRLGSQLPCTTSAYFQEVDQVARGMNYQYSEACRIVGESADQQEVKSILLRMSSSLATGEPEMEFIRHETQIQAEYYVNAYERKLESLRKWTDAFAALVVSAVLIIVVAAISSVIYDMGTGFVIGLVGVMIGISGMGTWMLYRTAPQETKEIDVSRGSSNQRLQRTLFMGLMPGAFVVGALLSAVGVPMGWILIVVAAILFPIGVTAMRFDAKIGRQDSDIGTFLRVLGTTASAIGTTPTEAMARIDLRSMDSLGPGVKRLHTWLRSRARPELCWERFVAETGSELVNRAVRVFVDGVRFGGEAAEAGERSSLLTMQVNFLRAKRKLISSTFNWLAIAMHATIVFLLLFVMEVVGGFGDLIRSAGLADVAGGQSAGIGASLSFSFQNIEFLQWLMTPVVMILSLVNAIAPKVVDGGYGYKLFYYLSLTLFTSGVALVATPRLAGMIFGITTGL